MIDLKDVPLIDLIKEIRNRQLKENLIGTIEIKPDKNVDFSIDQLTWPPGKFRINISVLEDITGI
jgi:hypothetical protein